MIRHMIGRHGKETGADDVDKAIEFILDVMNNFDHVRLGNNGALIFSIENGREKTGKRAISILLSSKTGDFYGIVSSGYEGVERLKKRPQLWAGSAIITPATDSATEPVTTLDARQGGEQIGSASGQSSSLSAGKDSDSSATVQGNGEKVSENQSPDGVQAALAAAERETDTEPTEAQKEAGAAAQGAGHASLDYRDPQGRIIPGNAISDIMKVLNDNQIGWWIDERGLLSVKGWCRQIADAINDCNIFLFVASERSNVSENTANEITYAISQKKHVIVLRLDKSPFHKDVSLNVIRIHYLNYFLDRRKALRDLVATIKKVNTDKVVLDMAVKIQEIPDEEPFGDIMMSQLVLAAFNAGDIKTSVGHFKTLVEKLPCESETGYDKVKEYIKRLDKIADERNYNVRCTNIESLISDIKKEDSSVTERSMQVLVILIKMFLYFQIGDIQEVIRIQKELDDVRFELSFLERNADTINEVTDVAVKGVTMVLGVAAKLKGMGGSLGTGLIKGATTTEKINLVKTSEKINYQKKVFETLRSVCQALRF